MYNPRTNWLRLLILTVGIVLMGFSAAIGQQSADFRVMTRRGNVWQPLPVDSLGIDISGMGSQVQMVYEFRIYNPFNEVLEGQALLPIPAGMQVSGFALETDGDMREAAVVDARLGRPAYENTVRRQIDPGLVEMLGPDIYKLRVFPLPAQGFRAVRIELAGALPYANGRLTLPLQITASTGRIDIAVEWQGKTGEFTMQDGPDFSDTSTPRPQTRQAALRASSRVFGESPALLIPISYASPIVWKDQRGWTYFEMAIPAMEAQPLSAATTVIYWDQSGSMAEFDRKKAISALTAWFESSSSGQVILVPFHLLAAKSQTFRRSQDAAAFANALRAIPNDGTAYWGSLDFEVVGANQYIFVSDGQSVLLPEEFPTTNAPVTVLTGSEVAAAAGPLAGFAATSRGRMVGLDNGSAEELAAQLGSLPVRIQKIEGDDSRTWIPLDYSDNAGLFRFCGKPDQDETSIVMVVGNGVKEERISVPLADAGGARLLIDPEIIHARARIDQQSMMPSPNEELIAELGVKYGLVTSMTSLLVLERLEDYVTYRVEPPAHMKKDYDRLVKEAQQTREFDLMSHIDQVAEAYQARIDWWNTTFKPRPAPKMEREEDDRLYDRASEAGDAPAMAAPTEDADGVPDVYDEEPVMAGSAAMDAFGGAPESEESEESAEERPAGGNVAINLEAWSSEASYIPALQWAKENWFLTYMGFKADNGTSPGFFIDVANWRWANGDTLMALQIIGNLAEMAPGDHELLRTLGRKLQQSGEPQLARLMFERVMKLRPEEPQSLRDLALVLAELQELPEAIRLLYAVVETPWPDRFPEISVMAAQEMNAIISRYESDFDKSAIDERLRKNLPTDLRVVLQWDQNDVDMDLWVTDPRGERCMYNHRETAIGGWMSRDFTGGYGPEEFLIKNAIPGTYKVEVNYYGNRRQEMSRPVLVQLRLIQDYGQPTQKEQSITRELASSSETITIGEFEVEE